MIRNLRGHNILFVIFVGMLFGRSVFAQTNVWFEGDLRFQGQYHFAPSSVQDKSEFVNPGMELAAHVDAMEDVVANFRGQMGPARQSSGGSYVIDFTEASIQLLQLSSAQDQVQVGLLINPWIEVSESSWDGRFFCSQCQVLTERYSYVARTDAGVRYEKMWDRGFWSLSAMNGEGSKKDEEGAGKDYQYLIHYLPWGTETQSHRALSLSYIRGKYENLDPSMSTRERVMLMYQHLQKWGWSTAVESFWGKDPVDAIQLKVADQVNLSDHGGEWAPSFAWSWLLKYSFLFRNETRPVEAFFRHDELNPMTSTGGRWLRQELLGFCFYPRQALQFSVAWSQVNYGSSHSSAVGDSQALSLTTDLHF